MSVAAQRLSDRFAGALDELIALVERCSADEWRRPCPSDGRSVGVVAQHVAEVNPAFLGILHTLAAGDTLAIRESMESVDASNARQATAQADVSQSAVLALLHTHGPAMVRLIGALDDRQLASTTSAFPMGEIALSQVIEWIVIGHTAEHVASIRASLGQTTAPAE